MRVISRFAAVVVGTSVLMAFGGAGAQAQDYAGSTIEILGTFDATGTSDKYGMQTTITFQRGAVDYDGFGNYQAPLNGKATKVSAKHTLNCGKEVVKEATHPVYFQTSLVGTTYVQTVAFAWKDSLKSRKCKDDFVSGFIAASETIAVDLSGGKCRFVSRFDLSKFSDEDSDQQHVTVKGECQASGPIAQIAAR